MRDLCSMFENRDGWKDLADMMTGEEVPDNGSGLRIVSLDDHEHTGTEARSCNMSES